MGLVLVPQPFQNIQTGFRRWLAHRNWLEAPLQRGILFNILPVFVQRRGANHTDLTAAQGGFDDIGSIHSALGAAGTHNGVQLIDKEDDSAVLLHLVQRFFDTLFEFAAVLGTGHHAGQIQRQHLFIQ